MKKHVLLQLIELLTNKMIGMTFNNIKIEKDINLIDSLYIDEIYGVKQKINIIKSKL